MSSTTLNRSADAFSDPKQRAKVKQLQELFPNWSNDGTNQLFALVLRLPFAHLLARVHRPRLRPHRSSR
jgi:hypothetical protein